MSRMFDKLRPHVGHRLECVIYGDSTHDPDDICIECLDCNEILVSAETEDYEEKYM